MDAIKVIHDAAGHTLTIWLDDPAKEAICEGRPPTRSSLHAFLNRL